MATPGEPKLEFDATPAEGWEEEFENTKFGKGGGSAFECSDYEGMYLDLKSFIRTLIAKERESVNQIWLTREEAYTAGMSAGREDEAVKCWEHDKKARAEGYKEGRASYSKFEDDRVADVEEGYQKGYTAGVAAGILEDKNDEYHLGYTAGAEAFRKEAIEVIKRLHQQNHDVAWQEAIEEADMAVSTLSVPTKEV